MDDSLNQLLLRAIQECEAVAERSFVKSAKVLATAMERAGVLTSARKTTLYTEVNPPQDEIIARYHAALVALVHEPDASKRLVEGQGNFGYSDGSEPPANPLFTECRLTELGRANVRT
jgi:hypothetical protein